MLARLSDEELRHLFVGYGYEPFFVEGSEPADMHQMAATLDTVFDRLAAIREKAASSTERPRAAR